MLTVQQKARQKSAESNCYRNDAIIGVINDNPLSYPNIHDLYIRSPEWR